MLYLLLGAVLGAIIGVGFCIVYAYPNTQP